MRGYRKEYNNNRIIKCQAIGGFYEDLAAIKQNGKWGYINTHGEIVIPCQYKFALDFSEGLAAVDNEKGEAGFINKVGNLVIPHNYDFANDFKESLAAVEDKETNKYGFVNEKGKVVIPFIYSDAYNFYDDRAAVAIDNEEEEFELFGYINKKGEHITDFIYLTAQDFKNGYARVSTEDHLIIINSDGEEVFKIPNNGINILESDGEMVFYNLGKIWQYKNIKTDKETDLPDIESISILNDGICIMVDKNGKYGAYDKDANIGIPFIYEKLRFPNSGLVTFLEKGLYGFLDYQGNIIIPAQYDKTMSFENEYTDVDIKNRKFIINKKGEIILELKIKESNKTTIFIVAMAIFLIIAIILSLK